jgi:hypothetical protein
MWNSVWDDSQISSVQDRRRGQCTGVRWNSTGQERTYINIISGETISEAVTVANNEKCQSILLDGFTMNWPADKIVVLFITKSFIVDFMMEYRCKNFTGRRLCSQLPYVYSCRCMEFTTLVRCIEATAVRVQHLLCNLILGMLLWLIYSDWHTSLLITLTCARTEFLIICDNFLWRSFGSFTHSSHCSHRQLSVLKVKLILNYVTN